MAKKLYIVEVERRFEMVVFAEDDYEAEELAVSYAEDEADNHDRGWDTVGLPVELKKIPRAWEGSIPYGDDVDDRSINEILEAK